ncbi:MAG: hypothetical protein EOO45_03270 [Flavobacterium sp.]|nr:MAG: hypothetical protein EOO45_03270 [Flavobacterium sp.]
MNKGGRNGLKGEFAALLALLGSEKLIPAVRSIDENGADVYLIDQEASEYARVQVKYSETSGNFYVHKNYFAQPSAMFVILVVPIAGSFIAFDMYLLAGEEVKKNFPLRKNKKGVLIIPEQYSFSVKKFQEISEKVCDQSHLEEIVSKRLKKYKVSVSVEDKIYRYKSPDEIEFDETLNELLPARIMAQKNYEVLFNAIELHRTICETREPDRARDASEQLRKLHTSNLLVDTKAYDGGLDCEHLVIRLPWPLFSHHTVNSTIDVETEGKE